ncbi:hypothetical protein [uncultured Pseudoalteromonas sp.]|uniref:hypothetical protein n=1 Tax=uncultured Pseudoalteromonas sp. TaxID=114053 RepID=UPI0030DBCF56|tara:strand:+ start:9169 stop:9555 length:387 start_codon:yes stop_codon:yes gene_type:complete
MEFNYLKLYFSLTLTGLTIFAGVEGYYSYKAYVQAKEAKAYSIQAQRDAKASAAREKVRLDKLAKQQAHKQQTINNAQKTNNEICSFWTIEYRESRTDYNKSMKDGACERARKSPVNTSTPVINLKGN